MVLTCSCRQRAARDCGVNRPSLGATRPSATAQPVAQPDARRSTTHTSRDTMADNKEALRALKIKTGVMTRVRKELAMYEQEVKTETEKLEAMKADGRDPHDVKQQDQVLGESTMMIGDCKSRMESAFNDLLAAVVSPGASARRQIPTLRF